MAATVVLCVIDILAAGGRFIAGGSFMARKKQSILLKADAWLSAAAVVCRLLNLLQSIVRVKHLEMNK